MLDHATLLIVAHRPEGDEIVLCPVSTYMGTPRVGQILARMLATGVPCSFRLVRSGGPPRMKEKDLVLRLESGARLVDAPLRWVEWVVTNDKGKTRTYLLREDPDA